MNFPSIGQEKDKSKHIWVKDGEAVTGVFMGDVYEFKVHWVDKKKKVCFGNDCGFCGTGVKALFQFRLNFIYRSDAEGTLQAGVYENDWFAYNRLATLNAEFPLEKNFVKIYKGMEGSYKVDLYERTKEVPAETLERIRSVELNVLNENAAPEFKNDEDLPF